MEKEINDKLKEIYDNVSLVYAAGGKKINTII